MSQSTIQSLVAEAAEDSLLIKTHLERTKNHGNQLRLVPGAAAEYLSNLEDFPHDAKIFQRGVVHSVFRNTNMAVDDIDTRLDALLAFKGSEVVAAQREHVKQERLLREQWMDANSMAMDIFAMLDTSSYSSSQYSNLLSKVINNVQTVKTLLAKFHHLLATTDTERDNSPEPAEEVVDSKATAPEEATAAQPMEGIEGSGEPDLSAGSEIKRTLSPEERSKAQGTLDTIAATILQIRGKIEALVRETETFNSTTISSNLKEARILVKSVRNLFVCSNSLEPAQNRLSPPPPIVPEPRCRVLRDPHTPHHHA